MSRLDFSKRIGLSIVLGHIAVSFLVLIVAVFEDHREVLNLLKISVPVTVAYFTTVLAWFGRLANNSAAASRKKMDGTEATAYIAVIGAFFLLLLAVPVIFYLVETATLQFVELLFAGAELIFGAGIAIILRTLFGGAED